MLEFIKETQSVWQRLKQANKPIVLYGMGDGAEKILNVLAEKQIAVSGIFASDEYVRGHSFRGFQVLKYSDAVEKYGDMIILVSFAVHDEPMMNRIYAMAFEQELYAPDVPVIGGGLFDEHYVQKHAQQLERAYELMADDQSRKVFADTVNFKLSGSCAYLRHMTTDKEEIYTELLQVHSNQIYVDLGAYDGDTIREYLTYADHAKELIAFEPDPKNYKKLERFAQELQQEISLHPVGSFSEPATLRFAGKAGRNSALSDQGKLEIPVDSVDHRLAGKWVDIIKMDVEGAEHQTLLGCKETIDRCAPSLIVSAYHRNEDLFDLPLLIHDLNPDYKIYLRHHPYIPAWETNLYAVKK